MCVVEWPVSFKNMRVHVIHSIYSCTYIGVECAELGGVLNVVQVCYCGFN